MEVPISYFQKPGALPASALYLSWLQFRMVISL